MVKKQHFGFTLLETLIAFTIVGALSVIMISFLSSDRFNEKTAKTKAHKVIDDIASVSKKIIFDDSVDGSFSKIYVKDTQKVCREQSAYINDVDCQKNIVSLYKTNLEAYCEVTISPDNLAERYEIDKSEKVIGAIELSGKTVLIFFQPDASSDTSLFKILVDVNGEKEPNIRNKDVFWVYIISTGVDLKKSDWPDTNI